MNDLNGQAVVVTGASSGIGREIVRLLASKGARVALLGRSPQKLQEVAAEAGKDPVVVRCDLRSATDIERAAKEIDARLGVADALIHAAGVWHDDSGKYQGPTLSRTPAAQIDEMLEVGLRGPFLLTRALLPPMERRKKGKIVLIACGFAGPHEARGWLHYYVVNQALEAFTRGLAAELRDAEIQVNCVAPWFVATAAVIRFYPQESRTALEPRLVAETVVALCDPGTRHVSGQVIELRSPLDHG